MSNQHKCRECDGAIVSRTRQILSKWRCEDGHEYLVHDASNKSIKPVNSILLKLDESRNFEGESEYVHKCETCQLGFLGHAARLTCRMCEYMKKEIDLIRDIPFIRSDSETLTYEPATNLPKIPESKFAWGNAESFVHELMVDAIEEAKKASKKFPQPNYVLTKIAEEAGEVVKEGVHCAENRGSYENLRNEIKQTIAMLVRLYVEGDQVHGCKPVIEFDMAKEAVKGFDHESRS